MAVSRFATEVGAVLTIAISIGVSHGQVFYKTNGTEYSIIGSLPGDQARPQLALTATNGYLVWEDNRTDGSGLGISARRLDSSLSGVFSTFRVNATGTNDQQNPQVTLLKKGGAAFVWQGGKRGYQHIYARFLSASNTWVTGDIRVNTYTNKSKLNPAIATLADGNVIVAWGSFNQKSTNSYQDVYAQRLSPTGQKLGSEFLVNQATSYNQRTPAIASLSNGRFIIIWVSEQQRFDNSVDIYARVFTTNGSAVGNEFLVNTSSNICADPSVAASAAYGGFMIAWGEKSTAPGNTGWDIMVRSYSNGLVPGDPRRVNSFLFGDQYAPKIAAVGPDYFAVWTAVGQDGSREGVFGQFLRGDTTPFGSELQVNTVSVSRQIHPTVASDGYGRFLTAWSSFTGVTEGMDLRAQRYSTTSEPLAAPGAPIVSALSSNSLSVAWTPVAGYSVAAYEVYADGASTPAASVTNTWWRATNLAASSVHSYAFDYLLTDGRCSPLSASASAKTYSAGPTWGSIPQEWMAQYFGSDILSWPSPNADSDGDGVSNLNEFLAGTDPTDPQSALRVKLESTQQGVYLHWNCQPGQVYQVQSSANLGTWGNVGNPRLAAGRVDSVFVGGGGFGYFRVLRIR